MLLININGVCFTKDCKKENDRTSLKLRILINLFNKKDNKINELKKINEAIQNNFNKFHENQFNVIMKQTTETVLILYDKLK